MKQSQEPWATIRNFALLMGGAGVVFAAAAAQAAVTITSVSDNITLGTAAMGSANYVSGDPNIVPDPYVLPDDVGDLLPYSASTSTSEPFGATYGLANLNDNDGQSLNPSNGTYAILSTVGGATTLTLTFTGGPQQVQGIAISNGYGVRDDGTYTITDAAGNVQGTYSILTQTLNDNHYEVDVFYIAFDQPITTTGLNLVISNATQQNTVSFREIEVFGGPVPEPASLGLLGLGACTLLARRRA